MTEFSIKQAELDAKTEESCGKIFGHDYLNGRCQICDHVEPDTNAPTCWGCETPYEEEITNYPVEKETIPNVMILVCPKCGDVSVPVDSAKHIFDEYQKIILN